MHPIPDRFTPLEFWPLHMTRQDIGNWQLKAVTNSPRSSRFCGIPGWSYGWRLAHILGVSINHIAVRFVSLRFFRIHYMDISNFEQDQDWIVHPLPRG